MSAFNPTHIPSDEVIGKEREALELRRAGVSFDVIAERLGYVNRGGAYKAFQRGLSRTLQQPADEMRQLEADRLDRVLMAVWPRAMRGDLGAVDRVVRISERRSRLHGLDHADGIADRLVALEADKVKLAALAFGRALDSLELTGEQRKTATRVLLTELRAQAALEDGGSG